MSCILHIESSTTVCSVAVSEDSHIIFHKEETEGPNHARLLAPMVDEASHFADSHAIPLDAVAVSEGPGSYTGLRIGVSVAKGLCYGRDIPLVSVPTLQTMCVWPLLYGPELPDDAILCPMIDARRMEVYAALYDRSLTALRPVSPEIIEPGHYDEWLCQRPVWFFGNGMLKCREILSAHPNAHFIDDIAPLARYMAPLAERKFLEGNFADVAYFEPFYLKDFLPTTPRNLLAGK